MLSSKRYAVDTIIFILSYSFPLLMIVLAISMSPWFNIWNNALSDLGHVIRSNVAPIFNLGLAVGGILTIIVGLRVLLPCSRVKGITVTFIGVFLNLIGVFDEVYGWMHFLVSVLFFTAIMVYLIAVVILDRIWIAIPIVLMHIVMWFIFLTLRIPRGAAVPELLAVFTYLPFYIRDYIRAYSGC